MWLETVSLLYASPVTRTRFAGTIYNFPGIMKPKQSKVTDLTPSFHYVYFQCMKARYKRLVWAFIFQFCFLSFILECISTSEELLTWILAVSPAVVLRKFVKYRLCLVRHLKKHVKFHSSEENTKYLLSHRSSASHRSRFSQN